MVAGILVVVASAEVERKGARQSLANRQRAEGGKPYAAGPRPFGFTDDRVTHHRAEAAALRRGYKALLGGGSVSSICRDLNERGLLTNQGKQWTHQSLRRTLMAPRYAGLREYRGEVIGPATWAPIVPEPMWRAAVAILTDKSRRTNLRPGGERARLLTGIATCGVCGDNTTVIGGSRGSGQPTYRCRTGKHLDRLAEPLESAVRGAVIDRLSRDDARDLLVDHDAPDLEALDEEALTIDNRIREVQAEFVHNDGSSPAWLRDIMAGLVTRRAEVEGRRAHRSNVLLFGDIIEADDKHAAWDGLPLTRQRAILSTLFTITIKRGKVGGNSRGGPRPLDLSTLTIEGPRD